ncbi:hypothetical protein [Streptacidiphilus sp. MAP12-33]|uniref:hypothetical protein n=1 Tax=Streptacidiphilus sp. MAP12-33 TaxID=3156266 RepID=UPI0035111D01
MWRRVREYAVPPSMILTATARRSVGDWAGACAAARVAVDLDLRDVARRHGRELATALRADLRRLAPDLLRWHLPRVAPDGLLRPGLTVTLARYPAAEGAAPLHLVLRTSPAWADDAQRVALALWDPLRPEADTRRHPHPHPSRRFRLDLHRHLWDARNSVELGERSGTAELTEPAERGSWATDRWADEARLLLRAERRASGRVAVRLGRREALLLDLDEDGTLTASVTTPAEARNPDLLLLPDAAVFVPPDLELLRAGLIDADALHPLVAAALLPGHVPAGRPAVDASAPRVVPVECRGERHRLAVVGGVLRPLDHGPEELRREELLVALTGTPLPCLQAIDQAHRSPEGLDELRRRLDHGDLAGFTAVLAALIGPDAVLPAGALRDELDAARLRRIDYALYRAGLPAPPSGAVSGRTARRRAQRTRRQPAPRR